MLAAFRTMASINAPQHVAVLGVMAEIADPESRHAFIAEQARELGIDVWAVGTGLYGDTPITIEEAASRIARLPSGAVVLLKGSRVAALERVVDFLGIAPPRK